MLHIIIIFLFFEKSKNILILYVVGLSADIVDETLAFIDDGLRFRNFIDIL